METTLEAVDVVVLCGGLGTRLKEVLRNRPKPMAEIGDRPFLDILIAYFKQYGARRFILCTGHQSDVIEQYYSQQSEDCQIVISHEARPLGTAGAIKNAASLIQSESFFVTNGDSFCRADLTKFFECHREKQASLSIVVAQSNDPLDYGSVYLDEKQQIQGFEEKQLPQRQGLINAGIYLFKQEILDYIPLGIKYSLEYDLFPRLAKTKDNCLGYIDPNPIIDIGTPLRLQKAHEYFLKRPRSNNKQIRQVKPNRQGTGQPLQPDLGHAHQADVRN